MRNAGWAAALELCDEDFTGFEVDLLSHALTVFADLDRILDHRRTARLLGVLKE